MSWDGDCAGGDMGPAGGAPAQGRELSPRLQALQDSGLLDAPRHEAFDRLTRLASRMLGAPVALLSLVAADRQFFLSESGLPPESEAALERGSDVGHSICARVVERRDVVAIEDMRKEADPIAAAVWRRWAFAAYLGAPLVTVDGHALGSFCVIDVKTRVWSDDDKTLVRDFAAIVMDEVTLRRESEDRRRLARLYDEARNRAEAKAATDAEHHRMLAAEASHRIKNSLQMVAALLGLQARTLGDGPSRDILRDAERRVQTIAKIHDRLWRHGEGRAVELAELLGDLCAGLADAKPMVRVLFEADGALIVPTDRATTICMLVNELVTNAQKYAYPADGPGDVRVVLSCQNAALRLVVADDGVGLPPGFDLTRSDDSLGMRLIAAFVRQLGGTVAIEPSARGARFVIDMPVA